jgi:hypothetical protein
MTKRTWHAHAQQQGKKKVYKNKNENSDHVLKLGVNQVIQNVF